MDPRRRVLVVPAAGRGSRLGAGRPKALVDVAGRPMIGWLAALYRPWVRGMVVVAQPAAVESMDDALRALGVSWSVVAQPEPTGMLDAVVLGCRAAADWAPDRIWVTWCDQIAVYPETVQRLAEQEGDSTVALPLVTLDAPYIHFDRDAHGRILAVRQRREGDRMPARGDSDIGLFSLSTAAATVDLPRFAARARPDAGTGERNFLPFIPHAAAEGTVVTIPATDVIEAVGVNTPDERARLDAHLRARAR